MLDTGHQITGLSLVSAPPGPHKYPIHSHEGYSVIGLATGQKLFRCRGRETRVDAPQIALANPGDPHGCGPINSEPWSHRSWYVSKRLMHEIAEADEADNLSFNPLFVDDTEVAHMLQAAHIASEEESDLYWQSSALNAMQLLVDRYLRPGPPKSRPVTTQARDRVKCCEDLLHGEISGRSERALDLTGLSDATQVSVNQVIRDFKRVHGVTPGEYKRMKQLENAKSAIRKGTSLTEAALQSGFADQSHFIRHFKKAYGMTPKEFRLRNASLLTENPI